MPSGQPFEITDTDSTRARGFAGPASITSKRPLPGVMAHFIKKSGARYVFVAEKEERAQFHRPAPG